MPMESSVTYGKNGAAELTVELDAQDLVHWLGVAEQALSSQVSVDGFRKGKVPSDLLRKHVGESGIREAALQEALQGSFAQVIREKELDVLKTDALNIKQNTPEKLVYSVTLTLVPEFVLPDLKTIRVVSRPVQVDDQEVADAVETIRTMRATFTAKEGPAQNGDRVEVDFSAMLGGKPVQGGESKNHPLVIGGKSFIPGFEEQLVGMTAGQEKRFSLKAPEEYFQKELAGKTLDFSVTVKNVQTVQLPELNDAFVQTLGAFKDVAQLRGNIRDGIAQEKEVKEKQRVRLEILDHIVGKATIPVPRELVAEQLDAMLAQFDRSLHEKGMELGMYLAHVGKTQEQLREEWTSGAEKQARISLVVRKIAAANHISAAPEEVEQAVNEAVQALLVRGQLDKENLNLSEVRRSIAERIVHEKTLDFVEEQCVAPEGATAA